MPRSKAPLRVTFHSAGPAKLFPAGKSESIMQSLEALHVRADEKGLESIKQGRDLLADIGMEFGDDARATKNGYGVLNLGWKAKAEGTWPATLEAEIADLRKAFRQTHGVALKYVIWAGMGGSAEDKAVYDGCGLLRRRTRFYILDSTDPAKLSAILADLERREKGSLPQALKKCLVVGMAMGMTSYEPVVNLEKLDLQYKKLKIDNTINFIYMTLPGSILDRFAGPKGFRRVELQLDNGNSTSGRHSGPLTRGSLYPLALCGNDLSEWIHGTDLRPTQIEAAFQVAEFLEKNAREGRDKITLFLPKQWKSLGVWTKQDFEESLGKSEDTGTKIVIDEKIRLANYFPPRDERQQRCFLVVNVGDLQSPDAAKVAAIRRAGYPLAVLHLHGANSLSRYMQFMHHVVFALAYLRKMNFVTQPSVELYKAIASDIHEESTNAGGIDKTAIWKSYTKSKRRLTWLGGLSIQFDGLLELGLIDERDIKQQNGNAPIVLAGVLSELVRQNAVSYGELTFFGDMRYGSTGKRLQRVLHSAADSIFRTRLKMPADVYEGPAMNHSYHEMIIGHGGAVSIVILPEKGTSIPKLKYTPDYHRAQWIATQQALRKRGRAVIGLMIRDASETSVETLSRFLAETARNVPRRD